MRDRRRTERVHKSPLNGSLIKMEQRNEIARLTQLVETLMNKRDALTKDLQWIRGETE